MVDICRELAEYGIEPLVADPEADAEEAMREYGIGFVPMNEIRGMDAVILAVAHDRFKDLAMRDFEAMFNDGRKVLLDLKGLLDREEYERAGYLYWRL